MPGVVSTLTASSTDPQGGAVTMSWDFGDGSAKGSGQSVTHTWAAEGTYTVGVVATNAANLTASGTASVAVVAQAPSAPQLVLSDTAPFPGEALTLAVSSIDPQRSGLAYTWDFGDGQSPTGVAQSRSYASEGNYSITVVARNAFGKSTSRTFTVAIVARAPQISLATLSNAVPKPFDAVTFTAAATDVQGSPITYTWDFKDGTTALGATATHAFTAEGLIQVTVTATNGLGKAASRIVNVAVVALPPVFRVVFATPGAPRPFQLVTLTATVTDPQGSVLNYAWTFADGGTASGATVTHTWSVEGPVQFAVTATNAFGKSQTQPALLVLTALSPSVPVISVSPAQPKPGDLITLAAASTDPQGTALGYAWTFGDGQTGSGASVTHAYAAEGTYNIQVTATNAFSKAAGRAQGLQVIYRPPTDPVISPAGTTVRPGDVISFLAAATDPGGFPITYSWNFGDGSGAATGASQSHSYVSLGKYVVTVTASNSMGKSSAPVTAQVGVTQLAADDQFGVYCLGPNCGAMDDHTYRGSGRGIWRYNNTAATPVNVDITIQGVAFGDHAMMVFSNGESSDTGLPGIGVLASPAAPLVAAAPAPRAGEVQNDVSAAHGAMLARNELLARQLRSATRSEPGYAFAPPPSVVAAPPVVGTTRVWYDEDVTPVPYTATVAATCSSPASGRNIVFWLDQGLANFPATQMQGFQDAFCGVSGGYDRLTGLLGDAWGSGAAAFPAFLIQDAPLLQDINIVILNVPSSVGWGGYFYALNNQQSSRNKALAFFINGPNAIGQQDYYVSTLVHELTHMVNFYQRSVRHGVGHDTWLEESSAMMGEDLVAPALSATHYDAMLYQRLPVYYFSRGNFSLINWSGLNGNSYGMGGSFGSFLNRRYGVLMFTGVSGCGVTAGTVGTSYQCVDALIKSMGGTGYAEEFARFGASIFADIGTSVVPMGFGFPALSSQGLSLQPLPLESRVNFPPPVAATLGATFKATSHTYLLDTVSVTASSYKRTGVTVPAKSTLIVVVE
jgi:PKD repeat protein